MRRLLIVLALLLAACGSVPAAPPTAQSVLDGFTAAGLSVENIQTPARDASAALPQTFKERLTFTIAALGDRGGQVLTCETKADCDTLYTYFDTLKALAGPHLFRSTDGRVIVQINSGLSNDDAAKYQGVVESLP